MFYDVLQCHKANAPGPNDSLIGIDLVSYRHDSILPTALCCEKHFLSVSALTSPGSVRPGDERFRNLPNGVKELLHRGPCHHASDRQYRGHACDRARSTSEVSALARRIESWIRFAKTGNSRQVSGARDASKTRSKLVTHNLSEGKNHEPRPYPRCSVRCASGFVLTGNQEVVGSSVGARRARTRGQRLTVQSCQPVAAG
jgi:hypothetical protein